MAGKDHLIATVFVDNSGKWDALNAFIFEHAQRVIDL